MSMIVTSDSPKPAAKTGVFEGVTFYHWLVVIIASCGWLFDCMDQRFFTLAKESALKDLLAGNSNALADLKTYLGYATASMMIGWGTGGIVFGMLSDRWGRVKTMVATLVVYSGFTGLSGFAHGWIDFTIYRFLVGLGVGGMFGAATTLVAESVPGQFRSMALGSLQALSATGNIIGSLISLQIPPGGENMFGSWGGWRLLFFVGILPALLVVPIIVFLKEPEAWKKAKADAAAGKKKNMGSMSELFSHPRWRHHTLVGLCLGLSGMVGLWGIGFFSPELVTTALKNSPLRPVDIQNHAPLVTMLKTEGNPLAARIRPQLSAESMALLSLTGGDTLSDSARRALASDLDRVVHGPSLFEASLTNFVALKKPTLDLANQLATMQKPDVADVAFLNRRILEDAASGGVSSIQKYIDRVRSKGLALQDVGSFLGMMVFTFVASYLNRRKAFIGAFVLCLATTAFVFYSLKTEADVYWMLPLMGFAQLAVFAGYSIYFPELYPTRLRGTGVGFCYNTVRYLAAPFPILLGYMSSHMSFRHAAIFMSSIYLLGLVALIWAPETKDQPLPED